MKKTCGFFVAALFFLAAAAPANAEQWFTVRINCTSPRTKNVENIKAKDAKDAARKIEIMMKNNQPYKSSSGCSVYEIKAQ